MMNKCQTDSHVIYGTLRLESFTKYPLITQELRLFAEIRIISVHISPKMYIFATKDKEHANTTRNSNQRIQGIRY